MTTTLIVIIVIAIVVIALAVFLVQKKNRDANISRADELRSRAAARAQTTIAPAHQEAAEAEARAEEARVQAERAEAEAREARVAAQQVEAEHEGRVRAADRLDPRVNDKSDDYAPQVGGTTDQQPTPPSEVNAAPEAAPQADTTYAEPAETTTDPTTTGDQDGNAPELPRRTRGAQEMPGKPIEKTDDGGGWFTRKDSDNA